MHRWSLVFVSQHADPTFSFQKIPAIAPFASKNSQVIPTYGQCESMTNTEPLE